MAMAVLLTGLLRTTLPAQLRLNEARPVLFVVLLVLVAVLILADPGRIDRQATWLRVLTALPIALITIANGGSTVALVTGILFGEPFTQQPRTLLAAGGVIWLTNVIAFALWYWDLDRGGAAARALGSAAKPASCSLRCPTQSMSVRAGTRPLWTTCTFLSTPRWRSAQQTSRRSNRGRSS
jgi:hypothetical protein